MTKQKTKHVAFPRPLYFVVSVSLFINVLLAGFIAAGYFSQASGNLDYAIVNKGISVMCSDEFRKTVITTSVGRGESDNEKGLRLALVDYPCTANGAKDFYEKGYDEYARSLGLNP